MKIDVTINIQDPQVVGKLNQILALLGAIKQGEVSIMADLSKITQAVADESTVDDSIIQLLQNISDQLKAAGTDQVALDALATQLTTEHDKIAAAVLANTPAATP